MLKGLARVWMARLTLALLLPAGGAQTASAARPIVIRYAITIAGFSIGTAEFRESITGSTYQLRLDAEFTGLVRMFFAPRLSAESEGTDAGGRILPAHYTLSIDHPNDPQRVNMTMNAGNVVSAVLEPPLPVRADRVPVLPEHKRGVVDPLSGFLVTLKPNEIASDAVCNRTIPVFDGGGRFDIRLLPDRRETLKIEGYDGPVLRCAIRYVAISGHRQKPNVTYMEDNRDISIALAPVPGRAVMIPLEISVATLIGSLRLTADRVESLSASDPVGTAP